MAELRVAGIEVRFGGVRALTGVDLEVSPGRVSGLIGPNGAGKTTLFNVVTGLQPPTRGQVLWDGRNITRMGPTKRARLGVGRTFQRLEVFGTLTARENVLMAAETQRGKVPSGLSPGQWADQLLERVGIAHVAAEPTDLLPTGLARLVELARALAINPSVLLLDEPSSGLDQQETDALGRVLVSLAEEGRAVLLVEHDMRLVMEVSSEVTVLDFGQVIAAGDPATVQADPMVQAAYLGANSEEEDGSSAEPPAARVRLDPAPARASEAVDASGGTGGPPALELVGIRAAYGRIEVVHGVDLTLHRGSVFALLGPNGAGKSTLLKVASGRMAPLSGTVRLAGEDIARVAPQRLVRRGLCTVPEGRAIFPNLTVAENVLMYTYRAKAVSARDIEEKAFARFPVLGERRKQLAGTLSGGEQQMLAVARALYTDPRVLLLDELSMGLAPLIVAQLYEAVADLVARESLAVLVVEQFAETALEAADRAAIMVNGRIEHSGTPAEISQQVVEAYMGSAV